LNLIFSGTPTASEFSGLFSASKENSLLMSSKEHQRLGLKYVSLNRLSQALNVR
jgi:hypothetical protein